MSPKSSGPQAGGQMVRHRQSRGRRRPRAGPLSADFEAPARCAHPLRTGLHGAQVPRHGADRDGRPRGMPHHRRRGRRHPDEVVNGLFIQQEVLSRRGAALRWWPSARATTGSASFRYFEPPMARREGPSAKAAFPAGRGRGLYEEAHYQENRYMANVAGAGFDAHGCGSSHLKKKGRRTAGSHGVWSGNSSVINPPE